MMSHSYESNERAHECATLAHQSFHPLTRRQSGGGLPHVGRPEAQTLLLQPGPSLLLQLLLDLIDLLC